MNADSPGNLADRAHEAAEVIRAIAGDEPPRVGLILGSGLGGWVDRLEAATVVSYERIPHLARPSVSGHAGELYRGRCSDVPLAVFRGRLHYYEGHDLEAVTFPIRILQQLGASGVILTAAAGGIRDDLEPGDVVVLEDHLNLIGSSPLRGPNDPRLGTRFPDMTSVYDPTRSALAFRLGIEQSLRAHRGIYASVPGPQYETPAEVRMLRTLGADVVGMSTVPEAIAARHAGLDVVGLALVTNRAAGLGPSQLDHRDVLAIGKLVAGPLGDMLQTLIVQGWATTEAKPDIEEP